MRQTLSIFLFSVLTTLSIFPQTAFAQSSYSCDCSFDAYNCTDFANGADAQACFLYCGSQGAGDIHRLDRNLNAIACDALTAQTAVIPIPEPVYVAPTAIPAAAPAYEVCSCGGDYYDCSTFSGPSHAQGCYDYCAVQGLGDVHLMDSDGDGFACFVSGNAIPIEPIPVAPTAVSPSYTIIPTPEILYVTPTAMPAAVPAYEVCSCSGDYYDCNIFSGPSHAQGCYDYCAGQGLGDVHLMDPDGDGFACLVSDAVPATPILVAPTATPTPYVPATAIPVYVAPTDIPTVYVPSTMIPSPADTPIPYTPPTAVPVYVAPTATPTIYVAPTIVPMAPVPAATMLPYIPGLDIDGKVANPEVCACDSDHYNCDSFSNQGDATACANYCNNLGYGDIHRLDQGGIEGDICEAHFDDASIPFDTMEVPDSVCDCSGNVYNCSSFVTQLEAQGCFNYCYRSGYGDIHRIDGSDGDLLACESLP